MAENYLLGMDMGTTNIKANIMDTKGNVIATASRPSHLIFPAANQIEQDANEWWDNAKAVFKEITTATGKEIVENIRGISISSHVISLLPIDKEGNPVRNAMIWMDTRSDEELNYITDTLGFDHFVSIVGGQPSTAFLPGKLLWFKKHEPEAFAKTEKLLQANGFINYKLTGQMVIDLDSASRCQCLDINSLTWSDEIAKVLDVDFNALLPQPSKITDIIGTVTEEAAAETGLASGIPVVAGCSDAMASMYATGLSQLGEAGESSGTTSLVFVGSPVQSRSDVPVVTKPCAIDGMPYIFDGPINASGASIKWYLDTFGQADKEEAEKLGINVYEYLNREALEVAPGSDGLLFFPYMLGERAPLWNSYSRGMFIGMSLNTERKHFVRSVFEGTAFALRHVMETIKEAGGQAECLRITGGGSKSRTWSQIKASMLHMPIYILDERSGDVPFGDVLIAGTAVGVFSDLTQTIKELIPIKEVIEPVPEWEAVYDKLYPYYLDMYQHLDADLRSFRTTVDNI